MISKVMKRKYITPVVYFFKYEEESELLANTFRDADSEFGASDYTHNANTINNANCTNAATDVVRDIMDSETTGLTVTNDGLNQGQIGAKDHDWFFDDNAFSDF